MMQGKLIARISSYAPGRNGLYNGIQMMSNDYWFRTELGNGRTFSGHFSLKR
ncbi:T9SS type B sorting domain-containing protein [Winogradskyella forsetii]|uniref:T9SS type B sorting domain-containing protein n=1 Tax=Winogradskyella forsetii TaxID=2686077 RepID=UPI0015B9ECDB|nr:T9SS type B sorting domain-containing protein [Winogradskyella forsetii]